MDDFTILIILGAFIVGLVLGWLVHERFIINLIMSHPEIMEEACEIGRKGLAGEITLTTDDGKVIKTSGTELEIEQVNGIMYAYMKENGRFVGQASTIEDLLAIAHKRFPGETFFGVMPEEDNQKS